jgi:hypothetical protein
MTEYLDHDDEPQAPVVVSRDSRSDSVNRRVCSIFKHDMYDSERAKFLASSFLSVRKKTLCLREIDNRSLNCMYTVQRLFVLSNDSKRVHVGSILPKRVHVGPNPATVHENRR